MPHGRAWQGAYIEAVVAVGVGGTLQGLERIIDIAAFLRIIALLEVDKEVAAVGAVAEPSEVFGRERHLSGRGWVEVKCGQRGSQQGRSHLNL